jgi:hypothetical protein
MIKKADAGDIFSLFYVALITAGIIILFFMGFYAVKALVSSPEKINYISFNLPPENNLLLQTTNITLKDGTNRTVLVFDAVFLSLNGKTKEGGRMQNSINLNHLLTKENDCYIIEILPWPVTGYTIDDAVQNKPMILDTVKDKMYEIDFINKDGEQKALRYYYGPCPGASK